MSKITFMFVMFLNKPSVDITLKNEFMPQKMKINNYYSDMMIYRPNDFIY